MYSCALMHANTTIMMPQSWYALVEFSMPVCLCLLRKVLVPVCYEEASECWYAGQSCTFIIQWCWLLNVMIKTCICKSVPNVFPDCAAALLHANTTTMMSQSVSQCQCHC